VPRRGSIGGTIVVHVGESNHAFYRIGGIQWFVQFVLRDLLPSLLLQDCDVEVLNEPSTGIISRNSVFHPDLAL
jgi:hypothetical protein